MNGFVALHRSEDILALMERHPNAFLLLSLIAVRARWSEEACAITGLRQGQALIGDWRKAGIGSEMRYRTAKKRLESCGFITTKTTGKGTVATLTDKAPFSVSVERATGAVTGKQQASNRRVTTKQRRGF